MPIPLQPYLADFLKRSIMAVPRCVVKIAAIEQRSHFRIVHDNYHIGLELGADIAADLNLDDFMVFDNQPERAVSFFRDLVYRHYVAAMRERGTAGGVVSDSAALIADAFTQNNVFDEFVRAAEGVPRDAINVLILAASAALEAPIAMAHVRSAAGRWYSRDKEKNVSARKDALGLLHWIIDKVIEHRQARGFMLRSTAKDDLIDYLFDERVLHVLKRNTSARDEPGVKYDAYKLDYGCYVNLINTSKKPQGWIQVDPEDGTSETEYIDVPKDDYRSLRRAILNLGDFYSSKDTPSQMPLGL